MGGCGAPEFGAKPDDVQEFPDGGYELADDAGLPDATVEPEPDAEPECAEDSCDPGVIDPARMEENRGICLSFSEVHASVGLNSSFPHNAVSVVDYDQDGLKEMMSSF